MFFIEAMPEMQRLQVAEKIDCNALSFYKSSNYKGMNFILMRNFGRISNFYLNKKMMLIGMTKQPMIAMKE